MVRTLAIASWFVVALGTGSARSDIRIDPPSGSSPPPSEAPATSPRVEKQGCNAQQAMAPEWIFGFGVLGLGLHGLRRHSSRRVPA